MSSPPTLAEVESAAAALSPPEQQELFLFLVQHLRDDESPKPEPRRFTQEQVDAWIAEDEAGMRRFTNPS